MIPDLTPKKAIQLAITTEQLGEKVYQRLANKYSEHKELADIFNRLAKDEKIHEAQFRSILDKLPDAVDIPAGYENLQFLRATAISEFMRKDNTFKEADKFDDIFKALQTAFNFEKSTLQYYQAILETIGESPALEEIVKAEKNHVTTLMKVIVSEAQFRGLSDDWI